jgi:hypothetical protein
MWSVSTASSSREASNLQPLRGSISDVERNFQVMEHPIPMIHVKFPSFSIAHQPKDSCRPRPRALHAPTSGKPGRSRPWALPSIWGTRSLCWRWEAEESMICLRRPLWKQSAADRQSVCWLTLQARRAEPEEAPPSRKRPLLEEHHQLACGPILLHRAMRFDNVLEREDLIEAEPIATSRHPIHELWQGKGTVGRGHTFGGKLGQFDGSPSL